jgi:AraC-like DNA-binding protein
MEEFITLIIWAAVIQGLLLGMVFITSRKHRSFANRLLGFFLMAFVFEAISDISSIEKIGNYGLSGYFTLPEVKILLPVLFLHFVLEKVGRSKSYHSFLRIQYFLAFGFIGLTLINILLVSFTGKPLSDYWSWAFGEGLYMGFQYYAFILTIVSFCISFRETRRYQKMVRDELSDLLMLDINWLWQFIFAIAPIILFWGAELVRIVMGGRGQTELTLIVYVFIAVFNYFVSYKAFMHQTLFDGSVDVLDPLKTSLLTSNKSSIPIDDETINKIKDEMDEGAYYLNQDLTIHDFAREIQIPARTISTCINQSVEQNFNVWVNNYRVEKAMAMLKEVAYNHLSIEGVGSEAGFKSRSAMYAAFKKKTGQSPGAFRAV